MLGGTVERAVIIIITMRASKAREERSFSLKALSVIGVR